MNIYTRNIILVSLVILSFCLKAQEMNFIKISDLKTDTLSSSDFYSSIIINQSNNSILINKDSIYPSIYKKNIKKDTNFGLSLGTSVGTSFQNSFMSNHYVSPFFKKELISKFSLVVGANYAFSHFNNMPIFYSPFEHGTNTGNLHSLGTYSSLIYKLNRKTDLLTSVSVEQNNFSFENNQKFNRTFNEMALGVNYKVNSNFSIGAQMNFGNKPYSSGFYTPNGVKNHSGIGF